VTALPGAPPGSAGVPRQLLLSLATAFTALCSSLALLAVPDLLMRFASSNPHYWGTLYHYNAVLMCRPVQASRRALRPRRRRRADTGSDTCAGADLAPAGLLTVVSSNDDVYVLRLL
jgi:hypothetical protein